MLSRRWDLPYSIQFFVLNGWWNTTMPEILSNGSHFRDIIKIAKNTTRRHLLQLTVMDHWIDPISFNSGTKTMKHFLRWRAKCNSHSIGDIKPKLLIQPNQLNVESRFVHQAFEYYQMGLFGWKLRSWPKQIFVLIPQVNLVGNSAIGYSVWCKTWNQ